MSQKEIRDQLLRLNAIITGRQHLSREQLMAEIQKNYEKSVRNAEVEQILADYVNTNGNIAIPGDVTDLEIKEAFLRYENNTIFRLIRTGHGSGDMGDIGHGESITQAARPKILELIKSEKTLKRDYKALSESALIAKVFGQKKRSKTRTL